MEAALDTPLDPKKNTIWCASAPVAWKALKEVVGGDIEIEDAPPWVGALNRSPIGLTDIDSAAVVTGAGWIKDGVVEDIQARVRETFGEERDPWLDTFADSLGDDNLIAYAYLATRLEFPEPLDPVPGGILTQVDEYDDGTTDKFFAQAFGLEHTFDAEDPRHQRIAKHVRVHGYEPAKEWYRPRGFVVVLEGKDAKGDVILARLEPKQTLRTTVEAALAKLSLEPDRLGDGDWLHVPLFDYHISRSYRELIGKQMLNPGFDGAPFLRVLQSIRFRLNESGSDLRSRMGYAVKSVEDPKVKFLIFKLPFLVLLKERHAERPYFAMWVANTEVLVREK